MLAFVSKLLGATSAGDGYILSVHNSQTLPLLRAALNTDPNPGKGGGDISIVGGSALLSETGPSGSIADIEDRPQSDQISVYVVREGDSLSQIAKMFGVTTYTIIWANDIQRGSVIHEGQTLVILPVSGLSYTVKKGDTLKSLAKKYKGDVKEIEQFNGLAENATLAVGDVLVIPGGEKEIPVYSSKSVKTVVRGTGGPTYSGYYIMPVTGGRRSQGLHGYNAVDIGATVGSPIVASASGVVIISKDYGWNGGYGNYIVVDHPNGTQTLYAHNIRNIVSSGQAVVQGQVIGYVGSSGRSTGPHTHFEIRGAKNPF
ncbi:MAG: peptidoglycan DD-metalloendopeptidase family protein [Parcubacteria group bacterium]|nr:peptidoglycan DD-metalloendopeptidase family protein [Parcubacteria group bacterium]